ncbi:guanine nucleotide-binding protein subunit alpha [Marasmius tenuissimus]|nr:guanine nucleotide-binding protein subunit alpha [Marasmius tenuissimus]
MDGSTEVSSIYPSAATQTSSSTAYGLGYLSGRAIKRFGESVLNGVDHIFINRQLRRTEAYFAREWSEDGKETKEMCSILIKFTHPGYVSSVRRRAFRMIMSQIGAFKVTGLVSALGDMQPVSTRYRHLSEVRDCICSIWLSDHGAAGSSGSESEKTRAHLHAGWESYLEFQTPSQPSCELNFIPALFYFASIAAHGDTKENARLVHAVDMIGLLQLLGLFEPSAPETGAVAGTLLLQVLQFRLESPDDPSVTQPIEVSLSALRTVHNGCRELADSDLPIATAWAAIRTSLQVPQNNLNIPDSHLTETGGSPHVKDPVKLLLLGSGESGKSTILRQLLRAHRGSQEFRELYDPDSEGYAHALTRDINIFLKSLVHGDQFLGGCGIESWTNKSISEVAEQFNSLYYHDLDETHQFISNNTLGFPALDALADEETRCRLQIFNRLSALTFSQRRSYELQDDELLRCYIRTIGLLEEKFTINDRAYHVWDCGGQRSERRKWIHMFGETHVVVFVVSITEYDLSLAENDSVNRMQESLTLFNSIANTLWFAGSKQVLVFNRSQLLGEKLRRSPLSHYFPDYTGGEDEESARRYIKDRFLQLCQDRDPPVNVHFINSLDVQEVNDLFQWIDKDLSTSRS